MCLFSNHFKKNLELNLIFFLGLSKPCSLEAPGQSASSPMENMGSVGTNSFYPNFLHSVLPAPPPPPFSLPFTYIYTSSPFLAVLGSRHLLLLPSENIYFASFGTIPALLLSAPSIFGSLGANPCVVLSPAKPRRRFPAPSSCICVESSSQTCACYRQINSSLARRCQAVIDKPDHQIT